MSKSNFQNARRLHFLLLVMFIFATAVTAVSSAAPSWYDQSHNIFVPEKVKSELVGIREFPVFWWNFIVLQLNEDQLTEESAQVIQGACRNFATSQMENIEKISCGFQLKLYSELLNQWARDYPRRHDAPSISSLKTSMSQALAKASLPLPKELLDFLRVDPLNSIDEFRGILEAHSVVKFEQFQGIYFDRITHRALIAVQFKFSPAQTVLTHETLERIQIFCQNNRICNSAYLLGPHASTNENESQIRQDLNIVSWFGLALLVGFVFLVVSTGRARLVLLIPPLTIAVVFSTLLTVLVFGRIHGLTLSFGPGIVGLCMHYGLQAAFSFGDDKRIWRANFFGILTTLAILLAVIWSQIPLIKQIMFFSSVGLVIGFTFFYFLHKYFPLLFRTRPIHIRLPQIKSLQILMLAVGGFAFIGFFMLKINFGIQQLNYESLKSSTLSRWLYESSGMTPPLIHFFNPEKSSQGSSFRGILDQAKAEQEWASSNGLSLSSVNEFLPTVQEQLKHLSTWQKRFCSTDPKFKPNTTRFSLVEQKFFAPFFSNLECQELKPNGLDSSSSIPAYLKDFSFENSWISLWSPHSAAEILKIKSKYPDSSSLSEIVSNFPKVLSQELIWMVPTAFILAFMLLIICCGNIVTAALALIPFFTGMGLFYIVALISHWPVTFISFIGFIKVFGFSLDYGIFVTDVLVATDRAHEEGVWSALGFNSISTTLGFLPLIFCAHPVLKQLGEVLVFGSIGSYFGAVWGLTPFTKILASKRCGR